MRYSNLNIFTKLKTFIYNKIIKDDISIMEVIKILNILIIFYSFYINYYHILLLNYKQHVSVIK
jgi:hypothetical protein